MGGELEKLRFGLGGWTEIPLYFGTKWGAFTGTAAHPGRVIFRNQKKSYPCEVSTLDLNRVKVTNLVEGLGFMSQPSA